MRYKLKHLKQDINRLKVGGSITGWEAGFVITVATNARNREDCIAQVQELQDTIVRLAEQHFDPDLVQVTRITAERP